MEAAGGGAQLPINTVVSRSEMSLFFIRVVLHSIAFVFAVETGLEWLCSNLIKLTIFVKSGTFSSPQKSLMLYYAECAGKHKQTSTTSGCFEVSECSNTLQLQ